MNFSVDLLYPDIALSGIQGKQQLIRRLRNVAAELFEQHRYLGTIKGRFENQSDWTLACLSMVRCPEYLPHEAVIGLRAEDEHGAASLTLCKLFAEELLRRCHDGFTTLRSETLFLGETYISTTSQAIKVSNGKLVIKTKPELNPSPC